MWVLIHPCRVKGRLDCERRLSSHRFPANCLQSRRARVSAGAQTGMKHALVLHV